MAPCRFSQRVTKKNYERASGIMNVIIHRTMPLKKGVKNIGKNIKTEMAHGKTRKQAIAIALNVAGKSKKSKKK